MAGKNLQCFVLYAVIFAFGLKTIMVEAIRCHQCNSKTDEFCDTLKENPKSVNLTEKYLKPCIASENKDLMQTNETMFCRKTTLYVAYEDTTRVIRSCGWLKELAFETKEAGGTGEKLRKSCINADNEGYIETICVCNDDGCNTASGLLLYTKYLYIICFSSLVMISKKLMF